MAVSLMPAGTPRGSAGGVPSGRPCGAAREGGLISQLCLSRQDNPAPLAGIRGDLLCCALPVPPLPRKKPALNATAARYDDRAVDTPDPGLRARAPGCLPVALAVVPARLAPACRHAGRLHARAQAPQRAGRAPAPVGPD